MQDHQNALQNAGSKGGFSYYVSIGNRTSGNQTTTYLVLILACAMFIMWFKSEERYRELVERIFLETNTRMLKSND